MKNFTIPAETSFTEKRVKERPDGGVKIEVLTSSGGAIPIAFSAEQFAQLVAFGGGERLAELEAELADKTRELDILRAKLLRAKLTRPPAMTAGEKAACDAV